MPQLSESGDTKVNVEHAVRTKMDNQAGHMLCLWWGSLRRNTSPYQLGYLYMLLMPLEIWGVTFTGPKTVDLRIRKPSFDVLHQKAVMCCLTGMLLFAFLRTAVSLLTLWFAKAEQPIGLNPLVLSYRWVQMASKFGWYRTHWDNLDNQGFSFRPLIVQLVPTGPLKWPL